MANLNIDDIEAIDDFSFDSEEEDQVDEDGDEVIKT